MTTLEVPTKLYETINETVAILVALHVTEGAAAVRQLRDLCTSQHLAHEATVRKLAERDALLAEAVRALELFSAVPEHGTYGGPLVGAEVKYEDGSEGWAQHEYFDRARATLTKLKESMK